MSETREQTPPWRPGPDNPVWADRKEAAELAGVTIRQFDNWRTGYSGNLPKGIEDNRLARLPRFHRARLLEFLRSLGQPEDEEPECGRVYDHPAMPDDVECPECGADLSEDETCSLGLHSSGESCACSE